MLPLFGCCGLRSETPLFRKGVRGGTGPCVTVSPTSQARGQTGMVFVVAAVLAMSTAAEVPGSMNRRAEVLTFLCQLWPENNTGPARIL